MVKNVCGEKGHESVDHILSSFWIVLSQREGRGSQAGLGLMGMAMIMAVSQQAVRIVMNQWPQRGVGLLHPNIYQVENENCGKV